MYSVQKPPPSKKVKLKIAAIIIFSLAAYSAVFPQACGNTYAKFFVKDSAGKVVRNTEFEFLKKDSDELAFLPESLRWVEADSYYFLTNGLWGGYQNVRIRVTADGFKSVERIFDFPLTNAKKPLIFQIRLNRVGEKDASSFEMLDAKQPTR